MVGSFPCWVRDTRSWTHHKVWQKILSEAPGLLSWMIRTVGPTVTGDSRLQSPSSHDCVTTVPLSASPPQKKGLNQTFLFYPLAVNFHVIFDRLPGFKLQKNTQTYINHIFSERQENCSDRPTNYHKKYMVVLVRGLVLNWLKWRNSQKKNPDVYMIYMGVSKNRGVSPQIINFNRVFHYKPSILGYPYFWKHPYIDDFQFWQKHRFFLHENLFSQWKHTSFRCPKCSHVGTCGNWTRRWKEAFRRRQVWLLPCRHASYLAKQEFAKSIFLGSMFIFGGCMVSTGFENNHGNLKVPTPPNANPSPRK